MHLRRLRYWAAAAAAVGLLTVAVPLPALAASSSVECGQLSGYTAPDPLGPNDGSLQLGVSSPWTVLATATISPAATTALPTAVNAGPTCLALDFDDDGNITAIDFSPTGTVSGGVDFDSGSGFYIFADRVVIPPDVTDAYPGLAALFVTSYQAGTLLSVTFTVDTTSGAFVGFDGTAAFCGHGSVTSGGDGQVGDAIIPAEVLDTGDLSALAGAGTRQACASVHAVGTIDPDSGAIAITTDVVITVAAGPVPTLPPTDTAALATSPSPTDNPIPMLGVLLLVAVGISGLLRTVHGARRTGQLEADATFRA